MSWGGRERICDHDGLEHSPGVVAAHGQQTLQYVPRTALFEHVVAPELTRMVLDFVLAT